MLRARGVCAPDEPDAAAVARGLAAGIDLHRFKRGAGLARVERVLGALRGMRPESLLDVGCGRGAFLWPLLEEWPELPVLAVELDARRLALLGELRRGGLAQLAGVRGDVAQLPCADAAVDAVTALEVLEHVAEPWRAARELVRVARRFVIASVPSHADDNPQHLRVYDVAALETLFRDAGARAVRVEHVPGHRIVVARARGA
jgi:ubiquinone/menaquinone biosynthesis C-methylase UbiE